MLANEKLIKGLLKFFKITDMKEIKSIREKNLDPEKKKKNKKMNIIKD